MKNEILKWFANGRVGASSKAMACAVMDLPNDGSHPHDPDDFNRCLMFLRAVPEARYYLDKVAELNEYWKVLIDNFADIEASFIAEFMEGKPGKEIKGSTYKLMRSLLDPIEDKDRHVVRFGRFAITTRN